jgi:hypothetical protein
VRDAVRDRDAVSILIAATLAGAALFASFVTWSVSGRYLLPIVPVFGLMLIRTLERSSTGTVFGLKSVRAFFFLVAAGVSMAVAWADASVADGARSAASEIAGKYAATGKTLWFQGHWGFQYYLGRGARSR